MSNLTDQIISNNFCVPNSLPFAKYLYDPEAQRYYNEWSVGFENRLRTEKFASDALAAHLGKFRKLFPSLSLIFYVADNPDISRRKETYIPIKYVEMASWWCQFLERQAERLYTLYLETGRKAEVLLLERIRNRELLSGTTLRDLHRSKWSGLTKPEIVNEGLRELQNKNVLVVELVSGKSGRPSPVVFINPSIYERLGVNPDGL